MDFLQFLAMVDERIVRINSSINGCVGNRVSDFVWSVDKTGLRINKSKDKFLLEAKKRYSFEVTYPVIRDGKVVAIPLKDIYPKNSIFYFICDQAFSKDWHRVYERRLEIAFENPVEYYFMNSYRTFDSFEIKQSRILTHNFEYPYGRR